MLLHALETGEFKGLLDPKLENKYNKSEMFRMIEAAATCVRHSALMRPRMIQASQFSTSLNQKARCHHTSI